MNIVQYHKKFREIALYIKEGRRKKFEKQQKLAQKKFNFLNEEANQVEFNERVRKVTSDLMKAFDARKTERQQQRAEQFKKWCGFKGDIFIDVSGKYDLWKVKHRDEWVKEQQEEWYKIYGYKPYGPNFERMYGETFTEIDLQKLYLQQRWL